jgi:hypothetical protein
MLWKYWKHLATPTISRQLQKSWCEEETSTKSFEIKKKRSPLQRKKEEKEIHAKRRKRKKNKKKKKNMKEESIQRKPELHKQ